MFTGIVQGIATVAQAIDRPGLRSFRLQLPAGFDDGLAIGASVAIDGTCLTVTARPAPGQADFDVMQQSLALTTLAGLREGGRINVERAAKDGAEIGGHPLSGHVDFMARVAQIRRPENNHVLRIAVPAPWMRYVFAKGYIAVNGASLTVAEAQREPRRQRLVRGLADPRDAAHDDLRRQGRGRCAQHRDRAQHQVFVDTVRDAIDERLGPLLPLLEDLLRQRGQSLDDLARPAALPRG
jgi:riboflavin synthase